MKKVLSKFFIFCIIGGVSLLIDIMFVNIFFFLKMPFPIARTISISIALIFNFFSNRKITFNAIDKPPQKQALQYIIVYITSNLVNLVSSILIVYFAGENVISINFASIIGTAISVPVSFIGSLFWTFKKQ